MSYGEVDAWTVDRTTKLKEIEKGCPFEVFNLKKARDRELKGSASFSFSSKEHLHEYRNISCCCSSSGSGSGSQLY